MFRLKVLERNSGFPSTFSLAVRGNSQERNPRERQEIPVYKVVGAGAGKITLALWLSRSTLYYLTDMGRPTFSGLPTTLPVYKYIK